MPISFNKIRSEEIDKADVRVYMVSNLPSGQAGSALHWIKDGVIRNATITLKDIRKVSHELGHAAGITEGHTETGLMSEFSNETRPTLEDAKLILTAYKTPGITQL